MTGSTKEFKVPFGKVLGGAYIRPDDANKGQPYCCPACEAVLTLKKGKVRRPHFAHKASPHCSEETVIHKVAKQLIYDAITDWKAGKTPAPVVHRACEVCHISLNAPLPDKVESVALEYRLTSGRITDVVLLNGENPVAAVEIWVHHEVDEEKAAVMGLPWIELAGLDVIINPSIWKPRQYEFKDKIRPCETCRETLTRFQARCESVAAELKTILPTAYYRYAPYRCYNCQKEMLIFTWPGKRAWDGPDSQPLREPIPTSIKIRRSNTTRSSYWGNICPHCNALQGDWHIHAEPESPLFVVHEDEEEQETFDTYLRDMAAIAHYYYNWLQCDPES